MVLNHIIQKLIRDKFGKSLTLTSHFALLSKSIFEETGETLAVNTLKRLFGKIDDVNASLATLNIIAQYLGFKDWEELNKASEGENSQLCEVQNIIFPKKMDENTKFEICYEPSRHLSLQVNHDKRCRVLAAAGGKIRKGDILDINEIALGNSLIINMVEREGKKLGKYIGGIERGVTSIRIIKS